ncbi:1462_t:CDS:2, partial [Cetraspora pellucida]
MSLELQQQVLENFFKNNTDWSLIKFLKYRDDFTYDKRKEHMLYKAWVQGLEYISVPRQLRDVLTNHQTYVIAITQLDAYVPTGCQTMCHVMNEKSSASVENFWMSIDKKLIETDYDLTLADEVTQQMKTYARSTTTRVIKRLLDSRETSSPKRSTRTKWNIEGDESDGFKADDEQVQVTVFLNPRDRLSRAFSIIGAFVIHMRQATKPPILCLFSIIDKYPKEINKLSKIGHCYQNGWATTTKQ